MSKRATKPAEVPPSHLDRIDALGLRTVSYLNRAVRCEYRDEWLPRDIVGRDGKTLVIYREPDDLYPIAGWEPWHDGMRGGRYESIHNALWWVERAIAIRTGRSTDFFGA